MVNKSCGRERPADSPECVPGDGDGVVHEGKQHADGIALQTYAPPAATVNNLLLAF
jgi:hypothetical protein